MKKFLLSTILLFSQFTSAAVSYNETSSVLNNAEAPTAWETLALDVGPVVGALSNTSGSTPDVFTFTLLTRGRLSSFTLDSLSSGSHLIANNALNSVTNPSALLGIRLISPNMVVTDILTAHASNPTFDSPGLSLPRPISDDAVSRQKTDGSDADHTLWRD